MNVIKKLRMTLQCQTCKNEYDKNCRPYMFTACKHTTCTNCLEKSGLSVLKLGMEYVLNRERDYTCNICEEPSRLTTIPLIQECATVMQEYTFKTIQYNHGCMECDTKDCKQNMQLCATCHDLKFTDLEDVKKHALCAPCAIRKHIRKGHQTVDFYPYLSALNFSSHTSNIKTEIQLSKDARAMMKYSFSCFENSSDNASECYHALTDMARRSKSTKYQAEVIEKMKTFIEESKKVCSKVDVELKKQTIVLNKNVADIKEWCMDRKDDCVEESEIIKLDDSANFDNIDSGIESVE